MYADESDPLVVGPAAQQDAAAVREPVHRNLDGRQGRGRGAGRGVRAARGDDEHGRRGRGGRSERHE